MFKRSLSLAPAVLVLVVGVWIGPKYDRFVLPAFDGHVYAAMAESPRVFTIAPWGYRILEPWMVYLLSASSAAQGFFWLNLILLAGVVFVVGWWLRRLGFSSEGAALAAAAFGLSPPIRVLLDYQVLVDPLALLILVAILVELAEPNVVVLMALFAAAALTKETGLLSLSLVPLILVPRLGLKRGLLDSLVIAAPALALTALLRLIWGNPIPANPFSIRDLSVRRMAESGSALILAATLSGLLLPAILGMFREKSVSIRLQAALLWFSTFSLILVNPYHYSAADLPRLSVFAWPAMLPLALAGLGFKRRPLPLTPRPQGARIRASVATLLACIALVAATDPYARAPFPDSPDPIAMVARLRETLKTARALDNGEPFAFNSRSGRFAAPVTQTFNLTDGRRHRWFLYRGFGRDAAYGASAPQFRGTAELLIPILVPRPARMFFQLDCALHLEIAVIVGDRQVGTVPSDGSPTTVIVPQAVFFRGDNIVRLRGPPDAAVHLRRFEVRLR